MTLNDEDAKKECLDQLKKLQLDGLALRSALSDRKNLEAIHEAWKWWKDGKNLYHPSVLGSLDANLLAAVNKAMNDYEESRAYEHSMKSFIENGTDYPY